MGPTQPSWSSATYTLPSSITRPQTAAALTADLLDATKETRNNTTTETHKQAVDVLKAAVHYSGTKTTIQKPGNEPISKTHVGPVTTSTSTKSPFTQQKSSTPASTPQQKPSSNDNKQPAQTPKHSPDSTTKAPSKPTPPTTSTKPSPESTSQAPKKSETSTPETRRAPNTSTSTSSSSSHSNRNHRSSYKANH